DDLLTRRHAQAERAADIAEAEVEGRGLALGPQEHTQARVARNAALVQRERGLAAQRFDEHRRVLDDAGRRGRRGCPHIALSHPDLSLAPWRAKLVGHGPERAGERHEGGKDAASLVEAADDEREVGGVFRQAGGEDLDGLLLALVRPRDYDLRFAGPVALG